MPRGPVLKVVGSDGTGDGETRRVIRPIRGESCCVRLAGPPQLIVQGWADRGLWDAIRLRTSLVVYRLGGHPELPSSCQSHADSPSFMLTEARVADRITAGKLELSYYWDPQSDPPKRLEHPKVAPGDTGVAATAAFHDAFFGDRLRLTMGPLVLSHRYARLRGRSNYQGLPGVFDLRETDNRLEVRPGESITINTIENVALDGSLGAITLPRLTHATAGLVLSTSYIDPFWRGVLVLNLANQTKKRIEIRFGERIAQTFFYDLDGEALPDKFRNEFAQKSHHYGLDWDRVEHGGNPFPLRKGAVPSRLQAEVERFGRVLFNRLTAAGLTGVVLLGLIFAAGQASDKVGKIDGLEKRVTTLERQQAVAKERERSLREVVESVRKRR